MDLPDRALPRCRARGARLPVRARRGDPARRPARLEGAGLNVLFVCVGNAGRSLLAERLLRRESEGRHQARSAGSAPGAHAHPQVLEVLSEIGIDASDHVPHKLDDDAVEWADVVVATCDDACPVVPGKRYIAWDLPDPKTMPLDQVRTLRDEIEGRVHELVAKL
ncbi:MAG TPA: arsenate reductase ArsC [Gaiellaceae bacterium]|nr:arsenate reductase ArsC [Gaiellaceae bacterium]